MPSIFVIIPAFDEEKSIAKVINAIPQKDIVEIIVVNNNSKDNTVEVAKNAGATVLNEFEQGYGAACLTGIAYVNAKSNLDKNTIIAFLDGDFSDYPEELPEVIRPIIENEFDMVIGSRRLGTAAKGSLTPQQIFGNWLATFLIKLIYKFKYTDLGPFRAIRLSKLNALNMIVPVNYKPRIGTSKVSGTVKGTILAGYKIITTIILYAFK